MTIEIKKINEVENVDIINFIKKIYEKRSFKIYKIYNWLYQTNSNEKEKSLIALENSKIIAHAGIIPFYLNLFGKKIRVSWFTDFIVKKIIKKKVLEKN